jgi:hypothetical protein
LMMILVMMKKKKKTHSAVLQQKLKKNRVVVVDVDVGVVVICYSSILLDVHGGNNMLKLGGVT